MTHFIVKARLWMSWSSRIPPPSMCEGCVSPEYNWLTRSQTVLTRLLVFLHLRSHKTVSAWPIPWPPREYNLHSWFGFSVCENFCMWGGFSHPIFSYYLKCPFILWALAVICVIKKIGSSCCCLSCWPFLYNHVEFFLPCIYTSFMVDFEALQHHKAL